MERCELVLADGTRWAGWNFGAPAVCVDELVADERRAERLRDIGEVVFNTAMSGYVEVLTDPSYRGQIVAMTYPHIGNYGVDAAWFEGGSGADAVEATPAAFVVREFYDGPVPAGRTELSDYLREQGVPGITGVDTRALTIRLRTHGSQNAALLCPADGERLSPAEVERATAMLNVFPPMEGRGLIGVVGIRRPLRLPGTGGPHLALYDCGVKSNIVRELQALGCSITLFPSGATAAEILAGRPDAVLLSNGPGDPAVLKHQVAQTRELIGQLPVLGICLGHQIIAEALGARTFKMSFGHHGVNHPVRDEVGGRVFVTSQNHGFAVDETTLPKGVRVWFRNANDNSVEGLRDDALGIRTAQFHPEAAPGPHDSRWIFQAFMEAVNARA